MGEMKEEKLNGIDTEEISSHSCLDQSLPRLPLTRKDLLTETVGNPVPQGNTSNHGDLGCWIKEIQDMKIHSFPPLGVRVPLRIPL